MSGNNLRNEGLRYICDGLKDNHYLEVLDISFNELTATACDYLQSTLPSCAIKQLIIHTNPIGNIGADRLANALYYARSCAQLLNLKDCEIGYTGLVRICDSLKHNQ